MRLDRHRWTTGKTNKDRKRKKKTPLLLRPFCLQALLLAKGGKKAYDIFFKSLKRGRVRKRLLHKTYKTDPWMK